MDARTDDTIPYGLGDGPWCGAQAPRARTGLTIRQPWISAPRCLQLVAADLAEDKQYQGRCLHCRKEISVESEVELQRADRRSSCAIRRGNVLWNVALSQRRISRRP